MFYPAMKPHRALRAAIALLFAWILPLQGFAVVSPCAQHRAADAPTINAVAPNGQAAAPDGVETADAPAVEHCTPAAGAARHLNPHFNCGDHCCCAAMALAPLRWVAPRSPTPDSPVALFRSTPASFLDRLDRPPRQA